MGRDGIYSFVLFCFGGGGGVQIPIGTIRGMGRIIKTRVMMMVKGWGLRNRGVGLLCSSGCLCRARILLRAVIHTSFPYPRQGNTFPTPSQPLVTLIPSAWPSSLGSLKLVRIKSHPNRSSPKPLFKKKFAKNSL